MKKNISFLITGFFLTFSLCVFGQADIGTTTHWYNRANFNPASIARDGYIYFFSNVRNQWLGLDGAPTVYNFQTSGYSDSRNSALGISFIRDDIGVTTALNPALQYAYRVVLKSDMKLSLGLSAGYYSRKIRASAYEPENTNDPVLNYTDEKFSMPDAGVGLELQAEHFIYGLSVTHLFSVWKPDNLFLITNHQYVYAFYKNSDSELYNITAGVQLSNRRNLTVAEATTIIRFKRPTGLIKGPSELFDLGLSVRTVKQATLITGLNISPNLRMGYTYDFNFSHTLNSFGTHEIILEYRIPLKTFRETGFNWYN